MNEDIESTLESHSVKEVGGTYTVIKQAQHYRGICSVLVRPMQMCKTMVVIYRFAEDGANFSINSDDPMVTGTWLNEVRNHWLLVVT